LRHCDSKLLWCDIRRINCGGDDPARPAKEDLGTIAHADQAIGAGGEQASSAATLTTRAAKRTRDAGFSGNFISLQAQRTFGTRAPIDGSHVQARVFAHWRAGR
jgi:hypothetical protein